MIRTTACRRTLKELSLSLVGAMSLSAFNIIAPHTFSGICNRTVFENWLDILGKSLPKNEQNKYPKRFLIMDKVIQYYDFIATTLST